MTAIPRTRAYDSTLGLLHDGYLFVAKRSQRLDSDIFATRLLLREVVCITGAEAANEFYRPGRFTRVGALPRSTLRLLQDQGSVATLDGEPHRHRKAMFMSLMEAESIDTLAATFNQAWQRAIPRWAAMPRLALRDESSVVLTEAVCDWAGVPVTAATARTRARELRAMVDGAGTAGPRNWWGSALRWRTERWARKVIQEVRAAGATHPGNAVETIAWHREPDGMLLEPNIAAVELLNILRPTVAVDRYIVFCALALHEHPEQARTLRHGDEQGLHQFVQEVRRDAPFFPFVAGRVLEAFEWRGHRFAVGDWVLLDLYGTNHDPARWEEPQVFRPGRFAAWRENAFDYIPQGGGDHFTGHRCAGEWITIRLMMEATRLLGSTMTYEVLPQDLSIDLSRMPALPKGGFVIGNVRPA